MCAKKDGVRTCEKRVNAAAEVRAWGDHVYLQDVCAGREVEWHLNHVHNLKVRQQRAAVRPARALAHTRPLRRPGQTCEVGEALFRLVACGLEIGPFPRPQRGRDRIFTPHRAGGGGTNARLPTFLSCVKLELRRHAAAPAEHGVAHEI